MGPNSLYAGGDHGSIGWVRCKYLQTTKSALVCFYEFLRGTQGL